MNGPSKIARLAKFKPNSRGLVVSYFYGGPSRSLDFFFNAKEVSGSQKMYQSRRLAFTIRHPYITLFYIHVMCIVGTWNIVIYPGHRDFLSSYYKAKAKRLSQRSKLRENRFPSLRISWLKFDEKEKRERASGNYLTLIY